MIYVKRFSGTYQANLVLASDADTVLGVYQVYATLSHSSGDTVVAEALATRDSAGNYHYTYSATNLKSSGVHKIHWRYIQGGTTFTKDDYITVYQQYITAAEFFDRHADLETDFGDTFDELERKTKNIIDTVCGQSFEPKFAKLLYMDGNDNRSMWLPERLETLTSVTLYETSSSSTTTTDYTSYIEPAPETKYAVRFKNIKSKFGSDAYYKFVGDWGWPFVPSNVTQAAELILVDIMNDDSVYRQHAVAEVYMDTHRMRFNDAILSSTGNIDADVLLFDYTLWVCGLI